MRCGGGVSGSLLTCYRGVALYFIHLYDVWGPMPELTITSPYAHYRVDSITFNVGNPMPESTLILYKSRLYPPSQVLWIWPLATHLSQESHSSEYSMWQSCISSFCFRRDFMHAGQRKWGMWPGGGGGGGGVDPFCFKVKINLVKNKC